MSQETILTLEQMFDNMYQKICSIYSKKTHQIHKDTSISIYLQEADMNHPILHVSLIVLGFYYGALFIYLAPDVIARLRHWFSGGKKNKSSSTNSPREHCISPSSSLDIKRIFMAHWVTSGDVWNRIPAGSSNFPLNPYNRQLWNPSLSAN